MMRIIDIAKKDLFHSLRSMFLVVFALVLPLLTTAVFYAAFGGLSPGGGEVSIQAVKVALVNLDADGQAGKAMAGVLTDPSMRTVMEVTPYESAEQARAAVDAQKAGVAVIIPRDFSASLTDPARNASVEVYQDPALSVGPAVVRAVVGQVLDGFGGARIAATSAGAQLAEHGLTPGMDALLSIGAGYGEWAASAAQDGALSAWRDLRTVSAPEEDSGNWIAQMISTIMAMMMVFYCFFTGTAAAQSILKEQEDGTLPRLFTTPTPRSTIIGGKLLAVFVTLLAQVAVLVAASTLFFKVDWGSPAAVVLATVGTAVLSASFATFLTSFLKNTRQAGIVYGVVVNLVGWMGISRLFVGIIPGMAKYSGVTDIISLFSPQGWAARIWQESLAGAPVWITLTGMLLLSAALFLIGVRRFNRRFAG
jgi:ABC-2 type transport system permease protein